MQMRSLNNNDNDYNDNSNANNNTSNSNHNTNDSNNNNSSNDGNNNNDNDNNNNCLRHSYAKLPGQARLRIATFFVAYADLTPTFRVKRNYETVASEELP